LLHTIGSLNQTKREEISLRLNEGLIRLGDATRLAPASTVKTRSRTAKLSLASLTGSIWSMCHLALKRLTVSVLFRPSEADIAGSKCYYASAKAPTRETQAWLCIGMQSLL
jgi:hypothetical protein